MSTLFPTAFDNFTNPSGSEATNATARTHSQQHGDLNDAVEAIQLRLGIDGVVGTTQKTRHVDEHASIPISVKNSLLHTIPTQLLVPYDSDDVPNFTSSLWPSCTLAQDVTRVCPATGLPSVKLTVNAGEVNNNEIRWFNHAPFTLGTNDVLLLLVYCPQSVSSGWVYLRLRSGTVGNEANYRTVGQTAGYMRQGWNVVVLKNTEVVIGSSEYGNTNGTSSNPYNAWTTGGSGVDENSTFRSTTILIGGVGGIEWNIGGLFKAPSGWSTAAIMFGVDDVFKSFYDIGLPIIESYGWKVTFNVALKLMDNSTYLNMTQIRDVIARGHEVWGHSVSHPDFTVVSVGEQSRQFEQSKIFWNANGIPAAGKFFAWPQNKYNDETISSAKTAGVRLARGAGGVHFQSWLPGLGSLCLPSLQMEQANPWNIDATLNGVCLRGQACITYMHDTVTGGSGINSYPAANKHYSDHLQRWCDLVKSHVDAGRATVLTVSQYFRKCGIDPLLHDFSG